MRWPSGAGSAGIACGIKAGGAPDLGLLVFDRPVTWAATFTRNAAAAAPVQWSRSKLGHPARALVVNSGNANACTGRSGERAVAQEVASVAEHLGCSPDEVLVASTGPIGVDLPVDKIVSGVPGAAAVLGADVEAFATSIMTTDTHMKASTTTAGTASVVGVAKGAAMLAPNMATMLAFVVTDAAIDGPTLQKITDVAVEHSFNRISVDACESTNDSVFVFATGASGEADVDALAEAVAHVCKDLAYQMVADAEGGSKVVRVAVEGAPSDDDAVALARAVSTSALWRAAASGADPNWGRIVSALGSSNRTLDLAALSVAIGDEVLFQTGEPRGDLATAAEHMTGSEISVRCVVGAGSGCAEFLTSDLTPEYVTLNAEGTT